MSFNVCLAGVSDWKGGIDEPRNSFDAFVACRPDNQFDGEAGKFSWISSRESSCEGVVMEESLQRPRGSIEGGRQALRTTLRGMSWEGRVGNRTGSVIENIEDPVCKSRGVVLVCTKRKTPSRHALVVSIAESPDLANRHVSSRTSEVIVNYPFKSPHRSSR